MAYELREKSGSIFVNKDKNEEKQKDFNGSCKIEGKEYWVAGWKKPTKDGGEYISLSFNEKNAAGKAGIAKVKKETGFTKEQLDAEGFSDDIPF